MQLRWKNKGPLTYETPAQDVPTGGDICLDIQCQGTTDGMLTIHASCDRQTWDALPVHGFGGGAMPMKPKQSCLVTVHIERYTHWVAVFTDQGRSMAPPAVFAGTKTPTIPQWPPTTSAPIPLDDTQPIHPIKAPDENPKPFNDEPTNNDGRTSCWWCGSPTRKAGGGQYDICTNKECGK